MKTKLVKTKRPSFSHHRGRTWDQADCILSDGTQTTAHYDTTWGSWAYVQIARDWFKFEIAAANIAKDSDWPSFNLRQA